MLAIIDPRFAYAIVIAAIGLIVICWALRQPTRTRIVVGLAYLGIDTLVLWHADILPIRPAPLTHATHGHVIAECLQILWWYVFARCLIAIGRVFILYKHRLHERKFATDLLAGVVYIVAGFAVTGFVFQVPVTGLLATSGAVAIVLGLALQSTANDLFSGLALTLERPYRIGDVIGLEKEVEGIVAEISWRATHIITFTKDDVIVPNSVIAKSRIVNYSFPERAHGVSLIISLDASTPPRRAMALLRQSLLQSASILQLPRPTIITSQISAVSIDYTVSFFVDRYEVAGQTKSEVLDFIHRHAMWGGLALASTPRDTGSASQPDTDIRTRVRTEVMLDRIDAFDILSQAERDTLSATLLRTDPDAGEFVFEEGQPGNVIYIIAEGVVGISRTVEAGRLIETSRLGPGDVFGTDAIIAESVRNATARTLTRCALYQIGTSNLLPLLNAHPSLASALLPAPAPVARAEAVRTGATNQSGNEDAMPRFLQHFAQFLPVRALPDRLV